MGPTVETEEKRMKKSTARVNRNIRGKKMIGDGRLSVIFGNESVGLEKSTTGELSMAIEHLRLEKH